MRLLVITNLFAPDRAGGASVFTDLCEGLADIGWDVTVYTTHPYYPEWRRKTGASPWRLREERAHGCRVVRFGLYVPRNPSRLWPRVLYEASFGVSLLRGLLRDRRFDAVMAYCPLVGAVAFGALRSLLRSEPLWVNVQDIPADAARAAGIGSSPVFSRMASWTQRILFRRARVASSISPLMVERLAAICGPGPRTVCCPNWLHASIEHSVRRHERRAARPLGNPLRLLYAGNIGKKQGLYEACRVLAATTERFELTVHGDGGEAETVRRWIEAGSDSRFRFGPFLGEAQFVDALSATDLFLITEKSASGASFVPSKLIPAIAMGTPLLAVCDASGPLGREVDDHDVGLRLDWNRLGSFGEALAALRAQPACYAHLRQRCLQRAAAYDRIAALNRIAALLSEMAGSKA